jgi:hypothetical protein
MLCQRSYSSKSRIALKGYFAKKTLATKNGNRKNMAQAGASRYLYKYYSTSSSLFDYLQLVLTTRVLE